MRLLLFCADILLTANQTTLNDTEVEHDLGDREAKMREVEAMLREMRHRSSATQRGVAEREKTEAEKRKDTKASTVWSCFSLIFCEDTPPAPTSHTLSFCLCHSYVLSVSHSLSLSLCLSLSLHLCVSPSIPLSLPPYLSPPPLQCSSVWTSSWRRGGSRTTPRPSGSESVWASSTSR